MPARPLPPVVGATENALRPLLTHALAGSLIGGYDEWVYLTVQQRADDSARAEELEADALKQAGEVVAAARTRLVDAGLLDSDGLLTGLGREQVTRCRDRVSEVTQALTAGIDPAAVQTTIHTLDMVRTRAEQLFAGSGPECKNDARGPLGDVSISGLLGSNADVG